MAAAAALAFLACSLVPNGAYRPACQPASRPLAIPSAGLQSSCVLPTTYKKERQLLHCLLASLQHAFIGPKSYTSPPPTPTAPPHPTPTHPPTHTSPPSLSAPACVVQVCRCQLPCQCGRLPHRALQRHHLRRKRADRGSHLPRRLRWAGRHEQEGVTGWACRRQGAPRRCVA